MHFTDAKNIPSIKEKGILSVEELNRINAAYEHNDAFRKDNKPDYISLSVSGMNKYVYRAFRYSARTIEHGVAVVIDAAMLYREIDTHRIYCNTNAAAAEVKGGDSLEALAAMYADKIRYSTSYGEIRDINRTDEKRSSYETTDIQAEILWHKCVPTDYILFYWDLEEDFFYGN